MYCVKCGVELADSEKKCPLCGTRVYCPDIEMPAAESKYPSYPGEVSEGLSRIGIMFILSVIFIIPMLLTLVIDLRVMGKVSWSGYVIASLLAGYIIFILPMWFRKPNPVIFIPCGSAAAAALLLYICIVTGGHWFLSLALPITASLALIVTAYAALLRYTRGAVLYICGGAMILLGGLTVFIEFLLKLTFGVGKMFMWSIYPLGVLFIIGAMLIVIAICRPWKEALKRKFFF